MIQDMTENWFRVRSEAVMLQKLPTFSDVGTHYNKPRSPFQAPAPQFEPPGCQQTPRGPELESVSALTWVQL